MNLPVTNKKNGKVGWISTKDILCFTTKDSGKIIIHDQYDEFKLVRTLGELEELLEPEGYVSLDKTNLVNKSKIRKFDKKSKAVFFKGKAISCCVSRRNAHKLRDLT